MSQNNPATTPGGRAPLSPIGTSKSVKMNFTSKTPKDAKKAGGCLLSDSQSKSTVNLIMHVPSCQMDRFVPNRSAMDVDAVHMHLTNENEHVGDDVNANPEKEEYQKRYV
jgi:cell division cycle protein 20 (cofactor of APC complex)